MKAPLPLDASAITPGQLEVRLTHFIRNSAFVQTRCTPEGLKVFGRPITHVWVGRFFNLPVIGTYTRNPQDPLFNPVQDVELYYLNARHDLFTLYQNGAFVKECKALGPDPNLYDLFDLENES